MRWIVITVLAMAAGCSMLQVEDAVTGVADGPVGTTITTVGTSVAGFLPPPWSQIVIGAVGLFGWVRGRRYKTAVTAVVEGVEEVLGDMKPDEAAAAKDVLKRVATENNVKPTVNAIVDQVKAA